MRISCARPAAICPSAAVRLGDVATVELGLEEERSRASLNREPAIAVQVQKQSGTNTVAVADGVRAAIEELQAAAPDGTTFNIVLDNSTKIRGSLDAVRLDLLLGAILAVAIIFFFLRDPAATFISALALPTSVLGTFMFVKLAGFSLNIMTTLALSLSIGVLIDDAIVVLENVYRHRERGATALEAASSGTQEIGLAVVALEETRFRAIVIANGMLPDPAHFERMAEAQQRSPDPTSFARWQAHAAAARELRCGAIIADGIPAIGGESGIRLSPVERAAYDAPYPDPPGTIAPPPPPTAVSPSPHPFGNPDDSLRDFTDSHADNPHYEPDADACANDGGSCFLCRSPAGVPAQCPEDLFTHL